MENKILIVIPARMKSKRLPNKPLIKLNGKHLIQWTYEACLTSKLADKLIIATDSQEIKDCVEDFGGEAILTSIEHKTGSDRVAEVAEKSPEYNIVINVQGDNPLITGRMIDSLIECLIKNPEIQMAALKSKITKKEDLTNPSIIKVVTDKNNFALYYSRAVIPYNRDEQKIDYYRNEGVYGFRRDFLLKYVKMPQGELEKAESLEQLRALEQGYRIYVVETDTETFDVNVQEDIKIVEEKLKERMLKEC